MDPFYSDIEFDPTDLDLCDSSSTLPFDFVDCSKPVMSPTHVTMFYPQLGYDLHPLLTNQRKLTDPDKLESSSLLTDDDIQLSAHLVIDASKTKEKQKSSKYTKKRTVPVARGATSIQIQSPLLNLTSDSNERNRKIFFCRACGKSFKFQTSLLRHNNKVHNCKYQCPTCHRVFSRQAYLDVHVSKPGSSCFLNCFTNPRMQKQPKI